MERKYKTNEVSKITGIPIDTLRYYEKIGVVSPKINEKNGYRYYEAWDINFIFDYYNYRKLEYSSKEALHFVHGATLQEQTDMLRKKEEYYQERIDGYRRLADRNKEIIEQVEHIHESLGTITIVTTEPCRYLCYRKNYDFYGYEQYMEEVHDWLQEIEMTENAIIIPKETMESRSDNSYLWALLVRGEACPVPVSEHMESRGPELCVKTVVEAGGEGTFHYSLLDPAMDYLKDHNYTLQGNPYGILLIRSHDEKGIHRYFNFYLPI